MSEALEVPVLGLGQQQGHAWTQLLLVVAGLLRDQRMARGQAAWSQAEAAARGHDRLERVADPAVRVMTGVERGEFDAAVAAGAGQTQRAVGDEGIVVVVAAPLLHGRAWGLRVAGTGSDGVTSEVHVRCVDESTAERLTEDLLRGTPSQVQRLGRVAEQAARRAQEVAGEVAESEPQRLARTAATVREVWDGELAERTIEATATQRAKGEEWNPAFGALAWRLHQLEERGYEMREVLSRLDTAGLSRPEVRNPAALAESIVEQMVLHLPLVAGLGDEAAGPDTNASRVDRGDPAPSPPRAGAPEAVARRDADAGRPEAGTQPVVVEVIAPPRTGVDRARMAELVRANMPKLAANEIVGCVAWPGLAKKLAAWSAEGLPVAEMLAELPHDRFAGKRKPAAYAITLLARVATPLRKAADIGSPESAAGDQAESAQPSSTRPVDAPAVDALGVDALAVELPGAQRGWPVQTAAPLVDPGDSAESAEVTLPLELLDLAKVVDRMELALSTGSPAQEAVAEQLLREADAQMQQAAAEPAAAQPSPPHSGGDGVEDHVEDRIDPAPATTSDPAATVELASEADLALTAAATRAQVVFTGGQTRLAARPALRPSPRPRPSPHPRSAADRGRAR